MSQKFWNEYYKNTDVPWTTPDAGFVAEVMHLPTGSALELGCGEGADSIWLAKRNWEVTAVDFAPAAIENLTQAAQTQGVNVKGIVADVTTYQSDEKYDLVFICYIHLCRDERHQMLNCATKLLTPDGILVYIGIAQSSPDSDIPTELLATPGEIVTVLSDLIIERADVSHRVIEMPGENFAADVITVRAKRPL